MATNANTTGTLAVLRDAAAAWVDITNYPDVPQHWLRLMVELHMRGGEMQMEDMQKAAGTSPSSITRAAVRLGGGDKDVSGMGWLEAFEDPLFRRRKIVRITPKGRAAVEKLAGATSKAIEKFYRGG
jgi:DNA-binding MarR family transcriptional regulator